MSYAFIRYFEATSERIRAVDDLSSVMKTARTSLLFLISFHCGDVADFQAHQFHKNTNI